jgi:uncharacterized repeat protein (TIGR02543 family)
MADAVATAVSGNLLDFSGADSASAVTGSFKLPKTGSFDSEITWAVTGDGVTFDQSTGKVTVTTPSGSVASTATLTPTVKKKKGATTVSPTTQPAAISISIPPVTPDLAVTNDVDALPDIVASALAATPASGNLSAITNDFALPVLGDRGTTLTWTSSDATVCTVAQTSTACTVAVSPKAVDTTVTLTADVSKPGTTSATPTKGTVTVKVKGSSASGTTSYTVTFNSNGGSTVASATVLSGALVTQPSDPTMTGSTLEGWYREAAFTTVWTFATDKVSANITLYAKWKTPNEADLAAVGLALSYTGTDTASSVTLPLTLPLTVSGATVSWASSAGSMTPPNNVPGVIIPTALSGATTLTASPIPSTTADTTVTLTATITKNGTTATKTFAVTVTKYTVPTFKVIYDANGASGGVPADATAYTQNQTATILGNVGATPLSVSGKIFVRWSSAATETTNSGKYVAGDTYTFQVMFGPITDLKLYAIFMTPLDASKDWLNFKRFTYDSNDESAKSATANTVTVTLPFTVPLSTPFGATLSDYSSVDYQGNALSVGANITFDSSGKAIPGLDAGFLPLIKVKITLTDGTSSYYTMPYSLSVTPKERWAKKVYVSGDGTHLAMASSWLGNSAYSSGVSVSADSGATWSTTLEKANTPPTNPTITAFGSSLNGQHLIAAYGSLLSISHDYGATWADVTGPTTPTVSGTATPLSWTSLVISDDGNKVLGTNDATFTVSGTTYYYYRVTNGTSTNGTTFTWSELSKVDTASDTSTYSQHVAELSANSDLSKILYALVRNRPGSYDSTAGGMGLMAFDGTALPLSTTNGIPSSQSAADHVALSRDGTSRYWGASYGDTMGNSFVWYYNPATSAYVENIVGGASNNGVIGWVNTIAANLNGTYLVAGQSNSAVGGNGNGLFYRTPTTAATTSAWARVYSVAPSYGNQGTALTGSWVTSSVSDTGSVMVVGENLGKGIWVSSDSGATWHRKW